MRPFIILLAVMLLANSIYAQQNEAIGALTGTSYTRLGTDDIQYNIVRSDKEGHVVWIKELTNNTNTFDVTLNLYMVFGYTNLSNNKITSNPGDYDYWLVVRSKNIESLVYPNPTRSSVFVFASDLSNNVRITLFDTNGREIMRERLVDFTTSIKLPPLSQGMYLYKIENDNLTIKTGQLCVN